MATILTLQHSAVGRPGRLGLTLRDHGFKLDVQRLDKHPDPANVTLDGRQGLIVLGGPQSPTDSSAWMRHEIDLIKRAHDAELPIIGVCLGCQLIGLALGGSVGKLDEPEAGFVDVDVVIAGQTDTITAGVPWRTRWFNSHEHAVTELPPGATRLMSSERCENQAFHAGLRTFAFQSHIEADRAIVDDLYSTERSLFERCGIDDAELARSADEYYPRFADVADRLSVNLASYAFPFSALIGS
ncbi:MAG: type 1 glutamine amidotransferase [Planctomycetota bacterium]